MKYGLIGEHLSHSYSAIIHGMLGGYEYELKELSPDELESFMKQKQFRGINVTIPYKQKVMAYLDVIDKNAKNIGAVNTVVNRDGILYGYNTDFYGMKSRLQHSHMDLQGKKVLILGSGGTSKTAKAVAENLGAKEIYRVSRTGRDGCIDYEKAYTIHGDADVIINTTPCGMTPDVDGCPVDTDRFTNLSAVADVIYNPTQTQLMKKARAKNINTTGGLFMLVSQRAKACEYFTDGTVTKDKTEKIYDVLALKFREK